MVTQNVHRPDWMMVPCNLPTTQYWVCQKTQVQVRKKYGNKLIIKRSTYECDNYSTRINNVCLKLMPGMNRNSTVIARSCQMILQSSYSSKLNVNSTFIVRVKELIIKWNNYLVQSYTYKLVMNMQKSICAFFEPFISVQGEKLWNISSRPCELESDFILCLKDATKMSYQCQSGRFECSDGTCVSQIHVCDGIPDCPVGEDEYCTCVRGKTKHQARYCAKVCKPGECQCPDLFLQCDSGGCISSHLICDGQPDCPDYRDESLCIYYKEVTVADLKPSKSLKFECSNGVPIDYSKANDLIPDCQGMDSEDEKEYKKILKNPKPPSSDKCDLDQLACFPGHSKCFHIENLCIFTRTKSFQLGSCRNGAHLQDCKDYDCAIHYKCPSAYCISYSYICDGVSDCPDGEDEDRCDQVTCPGLVKCRTDVVEKCVHPSELCDGVSDCQDGEDEQLCDVGRCPTNCQCLAYAVSCNNARLQSLRNVTKYSNYKLISIHNSFLDFQFLSFQKQDLVVFLNLSRNALIHFCDIKTSTRDYFKSFTLLYSLDVSYNKIPYLNYYCFCLSTEGFVSIKILLIHNSKILYLIYSPLACMQTLAILDLSANKISKILKRNFLGLHSLEFLNLKHNDIKTIDATILMNPLRFYIQSNQEELCCKMKISHKLTQCESSHYSLSSCQYMIKSSLLLLVIWSVGLISFLCNVFSLSLNMKTSHNVHNLLLRLLVLVDLLMACLFLLLGGINIYFSDSYFVARGAWLSGTPCQIISLLSFLVYVLDLVMFDMIALMRYLVIRFPFKRQIKELEYMKPRIIILLACASVFVIIIVFVYFNTVDFFISQNSMCLLWLVPPDSKITVWPAMILGLFVLFSYVFCCILYVHLIYLIKRSGTTTGKQVKSRRKRGKKTLKPIMCIILAMNIVLPIVSVTITLSSSSSILPFRFVTFISLFMMASSCTINPVLFIIWPHFSSKQVRHKYVTRLSLLIKLTAPVATKSSSTTERTEH